jgi:hypothetical protein
LSVHEPKSHAAKIDAESKLRRYIITAAIALATVVFLSPVAGCDKKDNGEKKEKDKGEKQEKDKDKDSERQAALPKGALSFEGGTFEASGVAYVPGTEGVLFVSDARQGEVFWMGLDETGKQSGDIKAFPLGIETDDPEDITSDGTYFYIIGSQGKLGSDDEPGLLRFSFDPATQKVTASGAISGLRKFLVEQVPELKTDGAKKGSDDGLNIEGICWDPNGSRWLLGLRSPLVNDEALLVPIKLRDPKGPFAIDNLTLAQPNAIRVPLEGFGIRAVGWDARSQHFWIIGGATETQKKTDFTLWKWTGSGAPEKLETLDEKLKPEGIARASSGGNEFVLVVGDASGYMKINR